jgi:hypothetical protein
MRRPAHPRSWLWGVGLGLGAVLAASPLARAGDITAFAARGTPLENWEDGYGAALSTTFLHVLSFEGEAARLPGKVKEDNMTSFTGSALLAPPVGFVTPYGGLGVGLFRQSVGGRTDTGRLKAMILGAKLKLGGLLVLKAEYRKFDLSGSPLLALETRLSVGAGISF